LPLQLNSFPLLIPRDGRVTFHDGFTDNRHGMAHDATDLSAPEGTLVLATTDGLVLRSWMSGHGPVTGAGWSPRGGFVVMLLDNNGFAHYYAHMRGTPLVQPGQQFRAGGVLGQVSNTGSIAHGGPMHLHYQIWETGSGRDQERDSATFTRRFGRAINAYAELARLARGLGGRVQSSTQVAFDVLGHIT
jgi:murein DD-endopeptidase MepM/ murein hydrolase activator NlpD